jgi:hypothetical protein
MRSPTFEEVLAEGNRRSLGRATENVGIGLGHPERFDELFGCVFSQDEVVRMRAGDALEKSAASGRTYFSLRPRLC